MAGDDAGTRRAFATTRLPDRPDVTAPDGSDVRVLLELARGGMAHFELAAGRTSRAVVHRTVDEIWYIVSGRGELWRASAGTAEMVDLAPGVCITIPVATQFQFRSAGPGPLAIVGVTMPPWPGEHEATPVAGPWTPSPDG
jgi:mannose-6-phosphate isomerase-like protein (cupin superfamily)